MITNSVEKTKELERFLLLIDWNKLTKRELLEAQTVAAERCVGLDTVLTRDFGLARQTVLAALSAYLNCPSVEYDERMPIPPELLIALKGLPSRSGWFPLMKEGDTVVIAAHDPQDPEVFKEVRNAIKADRYEFRVTLSEDMQWFNQDFLHAQPGELIGTERTGLAYWRNTMAHWRTRLAGYRNDLAKGRTDLAFFRWGLGIIALSDFLLRTQRPGLAQGFYVLMAGAGLALVLFGLYGYLKIRKTTMRAPGDQSLVEVTAATVSFLENYHFIETGASQTSGKTMLARLSELLAHHSTILYPWPESRVRTHLARERNVLAAQRTVAACYRTLYARARTGLAFMRTGIAFVGVGLGLMHYLSLSMFTLLDSLFILSGILMAIDGLLWYLPVRKEQADIPRCPVQI